MIAVLAVAVLGVGAWFLLSGDDDGGDDPESVAVRFVEAGIDRDCDAMRETLVVPEDVQDSWDEECADLMEELDAGGDRVPVEVLSTTLADESDDRATVTVEVRTRGGDTRSDDLFLVRRDGRWLVDFTGGLGPDDDDLPTGPDDIEIPDIDVPDVPDIDVPDIDVPSGPGDVEAGSPEPPPLDDPQIDDDPMLETYAEDCYDGDMAACDDLYWSTDIGSDLEEYAISCGGRLPDGFYGGSCEETLG